jgi:hypothetical protein
MPSSMTPGSSDIHKFQSRDTDIGLRRDLSGSALPTSRNPFHAGYSFEASRFTLLLRPARLLAPLNGSDWNAPATGDFYIQASNEISPLLDMTTTVTGLLCWRDSHPLEWTLASLHQILSTMRKVILRSLVTPMT